MNETAPSSKLNVKKEPKKPKLQPVEEPYVEPENIDPEVTGLERSLFKENPLLNETELGNTLRLTWLYAALMFFHHELTKWFCWTNTHWSFDTTNKSVQRLIHVLLKDKIFLKSVTIDWYTASFSNSKLRAVSKIAADLLPLPTAFTSCFGSRGSEVRIFSPRPKIQGVTA